MGIGGMWGGSGDEGGMNEWVCKVGTFCFGGGIGLRI
jgi:hypothetical protein